MSNAILRRKITVIITIFFVTVLSGYLSNLLADVAHLIGNPDTIFPDTIKDAKITRHLREFQNNVKAAPGVLAAVAELEESQAIMEQVQAESGIKVFGIGGTGVYSEQVTEDQSRQYQRINLKAQMFKTKIV